MASIKSLNALLSALQTGSEAEDLTRILSSATSVLATLSNPLNISLLSAHLIDTQSVWRQSDDATSALRISQIFSRALWHVLDGKLHSRLSNSQTPLTSLTIYEWVIAVIDGVSQARSSRWKHLCLYTGLLRGGRMSESQLEFSEPISRKLEDAIICTTNEALRTSELQSAPAMEGLSVLLGQSFEFISAHKIRQFNFALLIPILEQTIYQSKSSLNSGFWLISIDNNLYQADSSRFDWAPTSTSAIRLRHVAAGAIVTSLGAILRLLGIAIEEVRNWQPLLLILNNLASFSKSVATQWRQNRISEIEITEESIYLTERTVQETLPLLWKLLSYSLFSVTLTLNALMNRILWDNTAPKAEYARISAQIIEILSDVYFISTHFGPESSSQYRFIFLASIDILSNYPIEVEHLLQTLRRGDSVKNATIPSHPLDRCQDLFYFNLAEHFTTILAPEVTSTLLIRQAELYLHAGQDIRLLEHFEAAHSLMLSIFAAPQNATVFLQEHERYIQILFSGFPAAISARQFRVAVKMLVRITSPPYAISGTHPFLASTIVELVRHRMESASLTPLATIGRQAHARDANSTQLLVESERSVCAIAMIDCLPVLPISQLEDWLCTIAETLNAGLATVPAQLEVCRNRFWDVLSNGEMDVHRSALCVAWWGTKGGRELAMGNVLSAPTGLDEPGAVTTKEIAQILAS